MAEARSWREMYAQVAQQLERQTGDDLATWKDRIAQRHFGDEESLRTWLGEQGVTGYPQQLLVMERFGYPEWATASPDQLIAGQYADRPTLRPILEAVLARAREIGQLTVQARKGYVSLVAPRRTFAAVQATTKRRVDLGLRLEGQKPGGRLERAGSVGQSAMTVRIGLRRPEEVDEEVVGWLRRAYEASA